LGSRHEVDLDSTASSNVELGILQVEIDTGTNGGVYGFGAVGGEDHDAFEILQVAEEDYNIHIQHSSIH